METTFWTFIKGVIYKYNNITVSILFIENICLNYPIIRNGVQSLEQ